MPVVDERGCLTGIPTTDDVLQLLAREFFLCQPSSRHRSQISDLFFIRYIAPLITGTILAPTPIPGILVIRNAVDAGKDRQPSYRTAPPVYVFFKNRMKKKRMKFSYLIPERGSHPNSDPRWICYRSRSCRSAACSRAEIQISFRIRLPGPSPRFPHLSHSG